jgi:hypothetical protein
MVWGWSVSGVSVQVVGWVVARMLDGCRCGERSGCRDDARPGPEVIHRGLAGVGWARLWCARLGTSGFRATDSPAAASLAPARGWNKGRSRS